MKTKFSEEKTTMYVNNPSLKYTLIDLDAKGIDVESLANKLLGVSDFANANFLKHRNLNDKNKGFMMKELIREIHMNPYFYFSQVDDKLLFTEQSLALVYAVVNRIPCIVEYKNNKKSQVDAFVSAVTNWFDLSSVDSPICKMISKIKNKENDPMINNLMRRPSNSYISLGSLYKTKDIKFMCNFGLILGEDIDVMKSMDRILVKLAEVFSDSNKELHPIRVITKSNKVQLKHEIVEWQSEMFSYPIYKIFDMIDKTQYKSILIRF